MVVNHRLFYSFQMEDDLEMEMELAEEMIPETSAKPEEMELTATSAS